MDTPTKNRMQPFLALPTRCKLAIILKIYKSYVGHVRQKIGGPVGRQPIGWQPLLPCQLYALRSASQCVLLISPTSRLSQDKATGRRTVRGSSTRGKEEVHFIRFM